MSALELAPGPRGLRWPWPYLSADVPPVAARYKAHLEDFQVEELPALRPEGTGDHVHIRIEKRGITTTEAVRRLARALGRHPGDAGVAGRKDAQAVARQTISFEHVDPERARGLELEGVRVLEAERHARKLRRGALRGNRFAIRLRDVDPGREDDLRAVLEILRERGLPNAFGPQRFGARGDNAALGLALLARDHDEALARLVGRPSPLDTPRVRAAREHFEAGDLTAAAEAWPRSLAEPARLARLLAAGKSPARALAALPRSSLRFHVSALQAWIFNDVLAERLASFDALLPGDIAWDHASERVFPCAGAPADRERARRGEVSPTGPLPGGKLRTPTGTAAEAEDAVLVRHAQAVSALGARGRWSWPGTRRPLRVLPGELVYAPGEDEHGAYTELRFTLSPGSFASVLVLELAKDELVTG